MVESCQAQTTVIWVQAAAVLILSVALLWRVLFPRISQLLHSRLSWVGGGFRIRGTNEHPTLGPPLADGQFHLFISHTWRTGQDQPSVIKRQLHDNFIKVRPRVFLDVDDLDDLTQLETHIENSRVALLFLSRGYFLSRACLLEVRACAARDKPLILVHERDPLHGGGGLQELFDECPKELREYVFGNANSIPSGIDVIAFHRLKDFSLASLTRIAEVLYRECNAEKLRVSPVRAAKAARSIYLPSAIAEQPILLSGNVDVLVSSAHPQALTAAKALATTFATAQAEGRAPKDAALAVSVFPPSIDILLRRIENATALHSRLCLLLLLDKETFAINEKGETLAQHVRVARAAGVPILLVHDEQACEFDTCIAMTPDDLVTSGLYAKQIAVALGQHPLECVASHVLMIRQIHKFPIPGKRGIGEFDLGSIFGSAASRRSSTSSGGGGGGSAPHGEVPVRTMRRADSQKGSLRGSVVGRRLSALGSLGSSQRRLSNSSHIAKLQQLSMAPPSSSAHHAHVQRLADRRRRVSVMSKLVVARRSSLATSNVNVLRRSSNRQKLSDSADKPNDSCSKGSANVAVDLTA